MFNVTIRQVGIEEREEIIICCHEISDEVMSLANSIKGQKSFLLASKDGEMFKLDTKEIFYIESVDNKTFIYCKNNIYETKQKLYELEEILKGTKFFRCSKSMILNIGKSVPCHRLSTAVLRQSLLTVKRQLFQGSMCRP